MPVSLIPATRRSFIQAGAAAALSPWAFKTEAADSMTIELRALDKNHAEHGVAKTLAWR